MTKKDAVLERKKELKRICLARGVNNPIVGEEHYDPRAFDYSKLP